MAKNDSFFNEIYGTYFNVVSSILRQAQEKQLTKDSLELLVREQAFADSCLTIPKALQDGSWPLLQKDMTTPLRHAPAMPLTTLQRRWLKSLLTDKRIQLFDVDSSGLENVEPLFSEEQFVYFDRYSDGDNYDDPEYKQHFRLLLQAITEKRRVEISFISSNNEKLSAEYTVTTVTKPLPGVVEVAKAEYNRIRAYTADLSDMIEAAALMSRLNPAAEPAFPITANLDYIYEHFEELQSK